MGVCVSANAEGCGSAGWTAGKKGPRRVLVPQLSLALEGWRACSPSFLHPSDSHHLLCSPLHVGHLDTSWGEGVTMPPPVCASSPEGETEAGHSPGHSGRLNTGQPLVWGWSGGLGERAGWWGRRRVRQEAEVRTCPGKQQAGAAAWGGAGTPAGRARSHPGAQETGGVESLDMVMSLLG